MDEILLHLVRGWQGLVQLLYNLSAQGAVIPEDVLAYLEKMHRVLGEVIGKQREQRRALAERQSEHVRQADRPPSIGTQ